MQVHTGRGVSTFDIDKLRPGTIAQLGVFLSVTAPPSLRASHHPQHSQQVQHQAASSRLAAATAPAAAAPAAPSPHSTTASSAAASSASVAASAAVRLMDATTKSTTAKGHQPTSTPPTAPPLPPLRRSRRRGTKRRAGAAVANGSSTTPAPAPAPAVTTYMVTAPAAASSSALSSSTVMRLDTQAWRQQATAEIKRKDRCGLVVQGQLTCATMCHMLTRAMLAWLFVPDSGIASAGTDNSIDATELDLTAFDDMFHPPTRVSLATPTHVLCADSDAAWVLHLHLQHTLMHRSLPHSQESAHESVTVDMSNLQRASWTCLNCTIGNEVQVTVFGCPYSCKRHCA